MWISAGDPFLACNHQDTSSNCWDDSHFVQDLRDKKTGKETESDSSPLDADGVVVFGRQQRRTTSLPSGWSRGYLINQVFTLFRSHRVRQAESGVEGNRDYLGSPDCNPDNGKSVQPNCKAQVPRKGI
jgi:hypothetical protein